MLTLRSFSLTVLLLGLVSACAPAAGTPAPRGPAPEAATTVTVTNENQRDMVMYAVRSGMRFRLGTVPSLDVRTFTIPSTAIPAAGGVRLMADPVGTAAPHTSEAIPVDHGVAIEFRIKKRIADSYYAIRPG